MKPGKRFEMKFKKSLDLLPGWSVRLKDNSAGFGSSYGNAKMPETNDGDFIYLHAPRGKKYLIECKATRERSFPFKNITEEQLVRLMRFEDMGTDFKAYVAINFYLGDTRLKNECILVNIVPFLAYRNGTARKSIPETDAEKIGWRCELVKGNIWKLPFGRSL